MTYTIVRSDGKVTGALQDDGLGLNTSVIFIPKSDPNWTALVVPWNAAQAKPDDLSEYSRGPSIGDVMLARQFIAKAKNKTMQAGDVLPAFMALLRVVDV